MYFFKKIFRSEKISKINLNKKSVFLILFCFLTMYVFASAELYEIKYNGSVSDTSEFYNLIDTSFTRFNTIFHFPEDGPGYKYQVSLFSDKASYDEYVMEKTGSEAPKSETVFLRYSTASKSEVAAVVRPNNRNTFIRQLFTQYLCSFIPDPPAWLANGFSLYFEEYDTLNESPWLETAKALYLDENTRIPVKLMLEATKDTYTTDIFLPQAWLFVSFLLETPNSQNSRFLFDSLSSYIAYPEDDYDHFTYYYYKWIDNNQFQKDYDTYVRGLRSVKEDLSLGIRAYSSKNYAEAKELFEKVLQIQGTNYTAAYYLALCFYSEKNYKDADSWYKKALQYGADPALINWGLGASAYADKRYDEGKTYLLKAKQLDEATYGAKVDDLIQQAP